MTFNEDFGHIEGKFMFISKLNNVEPTVLALGNISLKSIFINELS